MYQSIVVWILLYTMHNFSKTIFCHKFSTESPRLKQLFHYLYYVEVFQYIGTYPFLCDIIF